MKTGDMLSVSDGRKNLYQVCITGFHDTGVTCAISTQKPLPPMSPPSIVLIQAVPKGPRMDWLIQKATELGVQEIIPVYMHRSVGFVTGEKGANRQSRWYRIATDAAKQCGRPNIPRVELPSSLSEAMEKIPGDPLSIFCDETETENSLAHLHAQAPHPRNIVLLVGPEGGTTDEERTLLRQRGFQAVTLGDLVLRTETAGIVAVALVRYEWRRAVGLSRRNGQ